MNRISNKDDVLRKCYARTKEAVDEIVGDPEILSKFLQLVNEDLPPSQVFSQREIAKRLFTLRKRGEANGGLVRKYRHFYGRNDKLN